MSISAIFSISVFYAFLSTFPNQPSPHLSDPQQWQNGQLKLPQLQKFEEILKGWVEPRVQETNRNTNNNNNELPNKRTTSDPETNTKNQATSSNVEIRVENEKLTIGNNMCKQFMSRIEETYKQHGSTHTINRTFSTALAVLGRYNYMANSAKNCLYRTSGAPMVQRIGEWWDFWVFSSFDRFERF